MQRVSDQLMQIEIPPGYRHVPGYSCVHKLCPCQSRYACPRCLTACTPPHDSMAECMQRHALGNSWWRKSLTSCSSPYRFHPLRQPIEKRFDSPVKPLGIVAHDRMAGAYDGGELATWDGGYHALGGIGC